MAIKEGNYIFNVYNNSSDKADNDISITSL